METFITPNKEDKDEDSENKNVTTTLFLTPSASNICIVCHKDITIRFKNDMDGTRKRKLWDRNNEKTDICKLLESYLDIDISRTEDFQCVCTSCVDKIKSGVKNQKAKRESLFVGRELVSTQFLRTRSYSRSIEPPSKKQLLYKSVTSNVSEPQIQIEFMKDDKKIQYNIPERFLEIIKSMSQGDTNKILSSLRNLDKETFDGSILNTIGCLVEDEAKRLCFKKKSTSFRINDVNQLDQMTFENHYEELREKAPNLLHLISKVAIRSDIDIRNTLKTSDSLRPSIVNAIGCLLFARNQNMNANALRNSLILRRGKVDKMCLKRFQKLSMAMDHTSMLKKQTDLAKENFAPVILLQDELQSETEYFCEKIKAALYQNQQEEIALEVDEESAMHMLSADADESFFEQGGVNPKVEIIDVSFEIQSGTSNTSTQPPSLSYLPVWKPRLSELKMEKSLLLKDYSEKPLFQSKYVFVGDNLDIRTKRRQYLIDKSNIDRHLYNLMIVQNRIPIPQNLIGMKSLRNLSIQECPFAYFIPSENDESLYKSELKILVLRDLIKYVPEIEWAKRYVVNHIRHDYVKEVSQISNCFPLGVLDKNEASSEGIIDIMREQHLFVPGHDSDHPLRVLSFGDLLTVERKENGQEVLKDHTSASARLEGLVPALADFHTYGNFFEVIWHLLYNASSGNDVGTLFQARNFLNARSVPATPFDNINSSEELLYKYSDALLISAFRQLTKDAGTDLKKPETEDEQKKKVDEIVSLLVNEFFAPQPTDDISDKNYSCPYCGKSYKKVKSLRNHIKEKHKGENNPSNDDGVRNYSISALSLCYLAKNFNDARKHGDGERISRLYKYLLMYFRLDSRHKYAYQSLHFLSQISFLLPPALGFELKWNRFVNTKGKIDSNVEIDRHLEHENKYVKKDLAQYQGKLTESSIERSSKSYSKIQNIMTSINQDLNIENPSGRHTKIDPTDDIKKLAEQFDAMQIFDTCIGRYHRSFPAAPKNFLEMLDMSDMRKWIIRKTKELQRKNIYRLDNIVVGI